MARPIIALLSPKGGTGKTTLAACLAAEIHKRGKAVVLVDADPQRSLTEWHGGADDPDRPLARLPVVTDPTERAAAKAVDASSKAVVVVDSGGFASRTQVALLEVADVVVIPCRASAMDARRALQAIEMASAINKERKRKARVVVVMNAATRAGIVAHIRNELVAHDANVLGSEVGARAVFAEAELLGSAPCWMGRSAEKAASEIAAVVSEILKTS
jgi:chromosome partitioning protein